MNLKTPGVYVRDASPVMPPVALVETGLPVFIGYTQKAVNTDGSTYELTPVRIKDIGEYEALFGQAYRSRDFDITVSFEEGISINEIRISHRFFMYECIRHYFDNEGGDCYIISIGKYLNQYGQANIVDKSDMFTGLTVLEQITEPDLIVFPDAVSLRKANGEPDYDSQTQLYQKALQHCANRVNRFLVGDIIPDNPINNPIDQFREKIGTTNLKFGAIYHPWLYTNYTHEFHLCEFNFFEKDQLGRNIPLTDISVFTSKQKSLGARTQQNWVSEALKWNKIIDTMISLINIESITRENINNLADQISLSASQISQENTETLKETVAVFFELVRSIIKVFVNLDGSIPASLQAVLLRQITADAIPNHTEQIIAWEKSETIRNLIDTNRTEDDVNADYDKEPSLSGSPWINELSVNDIAPDQVYGTLDEIVDFIRHNITPLAKSLAYSVQRLFEEAFAAEAEAEAILFSRHPFFLGLAEKISLELKKIPPSATMAGIYSQTDQEVGTWKAPANIRVQATLGPTQHIDDQKQENLNVHTTGKSINVIRAITGRGTRVWGARTLDGNSLEWRYIPVRRYFNFIEEVLKRASETFVFEPNASSTWVRIRLFLKTFLTRQWRLGALNGDTPDQAFFVNIGLGESMTEIDVLEGRMIIEIGLAAVRPAEFIVVRHICRMEEN